jgi:hypothetical protein
MRFKVFIVVAVALVVATPLSRAATHPQRAAGNTATRLHTLDGFDWH